MKHSILIINQKDNVAIALRDLKPGETVTSSCESTQLSVVEQIPKSHKISLRDIQIGEEIIKYGEAVGISAAVIRKGAWVHTHNLESGQWKAS